MKTTIFSALIAAIFICVCAAQNQPPVATHKPNAGFVADAQAAQDIARFILSQTFTPKDDRTFSSEAKLKDGVWTVSFCGPLIWPCLPIIIQIRQKTGAIIKYEDPAA
ncbi:MAG: hypothetical protein ACLPRE_07730 [Limisphaerales bacterium]